MNERDMNLYINSFLNNKGITNPFLMNIVSSFIFNHIKLYGDVIPFEILMERLNNNLNTIILKDPSESYNNFSTGYKNPVGIYEGFDKNTITMFFTEENLKNEQLREDFVGILLHELTHCAYNIKQNDYYKSEKQIFGIYHKKDDGTTPLFKGHYTYMEPIVNYVSCRVSGKKNSAYVAQTFNISRLTNVIDEKHLISGAFYSDEEEFKKCFDTLPNGAYEYFSNGMQWLNHGGEYGYKEGTEIMNNFFNGNIPNLDEKQTNFIERKKTTPSFTPVTFEPYEQSKKKGFMKILRKQGFINLFLLTFILSIICIILIFLIF